MENVISPVFFIQDAVAAPFPSVSFRGKRLLDLVPTFPQSRERSNL